MTPEAQAARWRVEVEMRLRGVFVGWVVIWVMAGAASCSDEEGGGTTPTPGCRLNSDCGTGERCIDGECVEETPCEGEACPCTSSEACGVGRRCEVSTGRCVEVECLSDPSCALGEVCVFGQCVTDVNADRDRDGVPDGSIEQPRDNCPELANPEQTDLDDDGEGDACDQDVDGDGVANAADDCPGAPNPDQTDRDGNGIGDACEGDRDSDGVPDDVDLCRTVSDPGQADLDGDGVGDACDADLDGDGVPNTGDNCPEARNAGQEDADGDGRGNVCDAFAGVTVSGRIVAAAGSEGLLDPQVGFSAATVFLRGPQTQQATASVGGDFSFPGIMEPGLYELAASAPSWVIGGQVILLDLRAETVGRDLVAVHQSQLGETAVTMVGSVELGEASDHSASVQVRFAGGGLAATAASDPTGAFAVRLSREGLYEVTASRAGYRMVPNAAVYRWVESVGAFLDAADQAPRVVLEPEMVTLRVRTSMEPGWVPAGQRGLRLRVAGQATQETRTTVAGEEETFSVVAGVYVVSVERQGFSTDSALVELRQGEAVVELRTTLERLDTSGLDLTGVTLDASDLEGIVVSQAHLPRVTLTGALAGLDLSGADLRSADLRGSDLTEARLRGADLSGALLSSGTVEGAVSLEGADLGEASLRNADLRFAVFGQGHRPSPACGGDDAATVRLDGANLAGADLTGAWLEGVDLRTANVSGARLQAVHATAMCAQDTDLTQADLSGATLDAADLSSARLFSAIMAQTTGVGARFDGAAMAGVVMEEADFGCALPPTPARCSDPFEPNNSPQDARAIEAGAWSGLWSCPAGRPGNLLPDRDLWSVMVERGQTLRVEVGLETIPDAFRLEVSTAQGVSLAAIPPQGVLPQEVPELAHGLALEVVAPETDSYIIALDACCTAVAYDLVVTIDGERPPVASACEPASFVGTNLNGALVSRTNLAGVSFAGASLLGAVVGGTTEAPAILYDADLRGAQLSNAAMARTDLRFARFDGAEGYLLDISASDVRRARFAGANLAGARMAGLRAPGASFEGAILEDAVLAASSLHGSRLMGARLDRAVLTGAGLGLLQLGGASLQRAQLDGASLRGADLRGADFSQSSMQDANLRGALLTGANGRLADLSGASLAGAVLGGRSRAEAARLAGANLDRADLRDVQAAFADLAAIRCAGAVWDRADLSGASMVLAGDCALSNATIAGLRLTGASPNVALWPGPLDDLICLDGRPAGGRMVGECRSGEIHAVDLTTVALNDGSTTFSRSTMDSLQGPLPVGECTGVWSEARVGWHTTVLAFPFVQGSTSIDVDVVLTFTPQDRWPDFMMYIFDGGVDERDIDTCLIASPPLELATRPRGEFRFQVRAQTGHALVVVVTRPWDLGPYTVGVEPPLRTL